MASTPVSVCSAAPASLELFEDAAIRRLLKARHQDLNKMEIRTKVLFATLYADAMRFTVYKFKIKSKARTTVPGTEWTIAKRYSEFFLFRQKMLKRIEAWEAGMDSEKKCQSKEFALIANGLRAPLATRDFPRKHMRVDTEEIIAERRTKLQAFVCQMLDAYADLSVLMTQSPTTGDRTHAAVREMFLELEDFLDIPKTQKEIDRRQAAAVLALRDVEFSSNDKACGKERTCCICLDDIEDEDAHDDCCSSTTCDSDEGLKLVQLPCLHTFHEDCVIDWFNTSTTCPLCRQAPYSEDAVSFDVVNM
jgi:hypothetical protein